MRIIESKNYDDMSRKLANIISAQIVMNPSSVLGLATGSTPIGTYKKLIEYYNSGDISFANVTSINLDEYVGLSPENDQSYRSFMCANLFNHIDINMANTYVPNGLEKDTALECTRYEEIMDNSGGIDLQLLGLGHNGHIGFNEPSDEFKKSTHLVDLAETTIEANKRFFDSVDDVPRQAYTMGIGSIMKAKMILVAVSGKGKADIVKKAFTGPITPQVPASILQMHPNVILVGDTEALSAL